jgi:hypothetical protein
VFHIKGYVADACWMAFSGWHEQLGTRETVRVCHRASGVTSKAANGGHFKTGQRNVAWDKVVLLRCLLGRQVCFCAPTPWTAFENMAVMEETIEHGGNGGTVAQQFAPVVYGTIRGEQSAGAFIAPHYDFQ